MVRVQRPAAVGEDQIVVDHRPDLGVREQRDLVDLVRGPKAVEEVDERHSRLEGRGLRDQCQIVRFLDRARAELGKTRGPGRHHVRMVAEDRERLGGDRARRDVKDRGRELARDLVHVGDHQQQALRGREGRAQGPALEGAVQRPRSTRLALHLDHGGHVAPDVGPTVAGPLVGELGHGRGGRDRIDRAHLVDPVGDRGRGLVAVDHRDLALGGTEASRAGRGRGCGADVDGHAAGSGIMSMAWQGHCSKQTAQPVHRS